MLILSKNKLENYKKVYICSNQINILMEAYNGVISPHKKITKVHNT